MVSFSPHCATTNCLPPSLSRPRVGHPFLTLRPSFSSEYKLRCCPHLRERYQSLSPTYSSHRIPFPSTFAVIYLILRGLAPLCISDPAQPIHYSHTSISASGLASYFPTTDTDYFCGNVPCSRTSGSLYKPSASSSPSVPLQPPSYTSPFSLPHKLSVFCSPNLSHCYSSISTPIPVCLPVLTTSLRHADSDHI